ncbi:phosphonate metabolism transcriptional regulator PhnF [Salipaludibacillus keqinensis]|uniref:Phosphonate metabolism transcriptional regulator PhnF n=1 Tax=Salipaludibacillus keqinensis TaxID=2045207 RepID=A0A323THQ7_9BACI|nr:GntR family transcriptional regulator [Salipaludibacillus keqinensis]PYZ93474.1 phosphonate metabolism transcriptional regulator PhnF [Salipaludibacillus keqinensis]
MINKNSPIPIYYQLEEKIKGQIEQGELQTGDMLPSEREYADHYAISRMTVRQAISKLVNDGYVYRKKGTGTFVAEKKIEQPLQGLTSFTEDMKARGMTASNRLIHFKTIPASTYVAHSLNIPVDSPVYEIQRIRLADGVPMALETNFLSATLVQGLSEEVVQSSLYDFIENKLNKKIGHATQIIESSIVNETEMELLEVKKDSPVLLIERKTSLEDGTPLELVKSSYRADRYRFIINMERN